jgi:hypothetical protein
MLLFKMMVYVGNAGHALNGLPHLYAYNVGADFLMQPELNDVFDA